MGGSAHQQVLPAANFLDDFLSDPAEFVRHVPALAGRLFAAHFPKAF
jgi:hypothetical protein